jgi:hypothetical protein
MRRAAIFGGALSTAVMVMMATGSAAFAISLQGAAHSYNDSPTTNQCLAAAYNTNDANAIMAGCVSELSEEWMEEPPNAALRNDTYYFTIENDNGSCLGVANSSQSVGARVVAWSCDSTTEQDWYVLDVSGGYVQIANANSSLCLDVSGGNSSTEGAQVIQEGCDSSASQYWHMPSS